MYHAEEHIKNMDKWQEYIAELKEQKGEMPISLEEATNFKFEWEYKHLPTNSH